MNNKIDFVVTWVNGNDEKWLREKAIYSGHDFNDKECRYRDMDTLMYWFRAVEKYTPWVNKIFFITYGHLPDWLNVDNEKLVIVKHEDYIPKQYLPTYNSNVIELNLHRIESLAENFVLFNDDSFIIDHMKVEDFYKNDLPCEEYSENINMPIGYDESFSHTALNNMGIINKHFDKRHVMKKNIFKYFNYRYGINNIRTLCLLPWRKYSLIKDPHMPVSLKKSQLEELWKIEPEALKATSKNRFRQSTDINQYLVRYMQLVKGKFYPRKSNIGKFIDLGENYKKAIKIIDRKKCKMVCLNDSDVIDEDLFNVIKEGLKVVFEKKLPDKSSFEL